MTGGYVQHSAPAIDESDVAAVTAQLAALGHETVYGFHIIKRTE